MNRARRALLKDRARFFAAGLVENIEAVASGQFDYLDLTHDEAKLIETEMQAISRRIWSSATITTKGGTDAAN